MNPLRLTRWLVLVLAVIVAGYLGLRAGQGLRTRVKPVATPAPEFPFQVGDSLPDVSLVDAGGTTVQSDSLLAGPGTVVIFLDPNCEGCLAMLQLWQQAVTDGEIPAERIVGISRESPEANERYCQEHGLQFPVYQDVESAYLKQHGVTTYPLAVIIGTSRRIESLSDNSKADIDGAAVRALMAR